MTMTSGLVQTVCTGNDGLARHVIEECIKKGVHTFIICPGTRNCPLVMALQDYLQIHQIYQFEERSAAFFALGRSRRDNGPAAVVTTSGTAAGELLPAAMEAFYTQVPLLLITADRPRRFRGTGAPQSVEQAGLFGVYAPFFQDLADGEVCSIEKWDLLAPAHLNVCFEDPIRLHSNGNEPDVNTLKIVPENTFDTFLKNTQYPLAIVSTLPKHAQGAVADFLFRLNIPVVLEGISGLREDYRLRHLQITRTDKIFQHASAAGYPVDGVLRIGGTPTNGLWRDLESLRGKIEVCSISETPYPGLSWAGVIHVTLHHFFQQCTLPNKKYAFQQWLAADREFQKRLQAIFAEEPTAEASLVYQLSLKIPRQSHVYLGNSLPIREWDLAATYENRGYMMQANRGANGIDGQISTFLGLVGDAKDNWALLGDLTTLYDMAGLWTIDQLLRQTITIVVMNNSGGQIFSRFFSNKLFLHSHCLSFKPLAEMWGIDYEKWDSIPDVVPSAARRLIEIIPDAQASERFWKKIYGI